MASLKVGSVNIQGGSSRKLAMDEVKNLVGKFDIFCLQETWLTDTDSIAIDGYGIFRSDRKTNKKKNCGSGGVVTLFKNELSKGVSKIKSQNTDLLWMKLHKNFFNLKTDIYLCNCYIPPQNSVVFQNNKETHFDILQNEIQLFGMKGDIIMIGDFNSRTGEIQENITDNLEDDRLHINTRNNTNLRYNEDKTVNQFGKQLIAIIEEAQMIILNGRTLGDGRGSKTCHKYNGSSTVDYMIVSTSLIDNIITFRVLEPDWFTDHSPISCLLKLRKSWTSSQNEQINMTPITKFIWEEDSGEKITTMLDKHETIDTLISLAGINDTNKCTNGLTELLTTIANNSLTKIIRLNPRKVSNNKNNSYVDHKLIEAKRDFKRAKRNYFNDKDNINRRIEFIIQKKKFKKIKYLTERYKKEDKLKKLAEIEKKQPSLFWKSIKALMPKTKNNPNISPQNWITYFSKLLNIKVKENPKQCINPQQEFKQYIKHCLPVIEKNMEQNGPLDNPIMENELEEAIKELKGKKATGPDNICNEILKCKSTTLHKTMLHLFNIILKNGNYPKQWMYNMITPIYKTGDPNEAQNYRGIAVSDSMNKVFTKILNKRIYNFLTENKFWTPNQNGFMKGKRTEDNIFILHTIFQKYVKLSKGKVYTAFIDFRKFFDTIDRECLFYKLLNCGITGQVYKVLKSAYDNPKFCIKTEYGLTEYFASTTGVKQGCILSPLLSNIYQNDLHNIFDKDCDPIQLNSNNLNSISWADDLVLFSTSKQGLQNSLDKLNTYCTKWGLSVNTNKTKGMTLSLGNSKMPNFTFNNEILENVSSYKYLGIIIHKNGKFSKAIADRISKANRATHMLKQIIGYPSNASSKLAMSLFDKQIAPILLYGSSIWGIPDNNRYVQLKIPKIDIQVKKQVQKCMNEHLNRHVQIDEVRAYRDKDMVVIKLHNVLDKIDILYKNNSQACNNNYTIIDHEIKTKTLYETVHSKFCKYAVRVPKHTSTTGVYKEMNRYPISIKAWVSGIAYWHRLETGTDNVILQNAFKECKINNHSFYQNISYLLLRNGLGNIASRPYNISTKRVIQIAKQNLVDQYRQKTNHTIETDDKFDTLHLCTDTDICNSPYLKIESPYIRKCYMYLRLDKAIKYSTNVINVCNLCNRENSTKHIILYCNKYEQARKDLIEKLSNLHVCPTFENMSPNNKFKLIMNLQIKSQHGISIICTFIKQICNVLNIY